MNKNQKIVLLAVALIVISGTSYVYAVGGGIIISAPNAASDIITFKNSAGLTKMTINGTGILNIMTSSIYNVVSLVSTGGNVITVPQSTGTILLTTGQANSLTGTFNGLLANGGHVSTPPTTTGTLTQQNGTFSGTLSSASGTFIGTNSGTLSGQLSTANGTINGFYTKVVNSPSCPYSTLTTDDTILVSASSAPCTINLVPAATHSGKIYTIIKTDTTVNPVVMAGAASDTVNGNATKRVLHTDDQYRIQSDGISNWKIISHPDDSFFAFYPRGNENRWVSNLMTATGLATTTNNLQNILLATAFPVPRTITIDQIGFNVTTTGTSNCRIGIYTSNATSFPANLVTNSDTGNIDVTAVGARTVTYGSPITLRGDELYFLATNCATSTPKVAAQALGNVNPILGISKLSGGFGITGTGSLGVGWSYSLTYGALPSSFSNTATIVVGANIPIVYLHISG